MVLLFYVSVLQGIFPTNKNILCLIYSIIIDSSNYNIDIILVSNLLLYFSFAS
jgi:hypothetical protein